MVISPKDRKLLWVRSGNQCAFPGCSHPLTLDGSGGAVTVVGHEAHIVSQSPSGPRGGQEIPGGHIAGVPNLLLLCPTHHRIADEQPDVYSVKALRDIKDAHENRVREHQESEKTARRLEAEQFSGICEGIRTFLVWRIGETLLAVCTFGSDPVRVASNRWRGTGLIIKAVSSHFGPKQLATYSEADPDIEFSIEGNKFRIVEWSFDVTADDLIPFVEKCYDLERLDREPSVARLACASVNGKFTSDDVVNQYYRSIAGGENPEAVVFRLREIGLANPSAVISALSRLRDESALDGAVAEAAMIVQSELISYAKALPIDDT